MVKIPNLNNYTHNVSGNVHRPKCASDPCLCDSGNPVETTCVAPSCFSGLAKIASFVVSLCEPNPNRVHQTPAGKPLLQIFQNSPVRFSFRIFACPHLPMMQPLYWFIRSRATASREVSARCCAWPNPGTPGERTTFATFQIKSYTSLRALIGIMFCFDRTITTEIWSRDIEGCCNCWKEKPNIHQLHDVINHNRCHAAPRVEWRQKRS